MCRLFWLLVLSLVTSLIFAYPTQHAFPAFKIIGNLYYVGTDDLASYLIVTPKGNILINSNLAPDVPLIKASVEMLGFKWSATKILLISHAHLDHAAGSKLIKQQTNASYRVMAADVPLVTSGGRADFYYGNDKSMYFPATGVDKVLHDGEQVKLGDTVLTAHLTPGHTKGCTTWTLNVHENHKTYKVVILGSVNVNPGYNLIHDTQYPTMAKDFKQSFKTLKSLPCDVFLGAHAQYFNLQQKYALLNQSGVNPFIDALGFKQHIQQKQQEFYAKLKQQSADKK